MKISIFQNAALNYIKTLPASSGEAEAVHTREAIGNKKNQINLLK